MNNYKMAMNDQIIEKNAFTRGLSMADDFDRQNGTKLGPRLRHELCLELGFIKIVEIDGKRVEVPTPRTRQALHNRQNGYVPHTAIERRAIEQTFKAYLGTTDIWGLA
jgi:hypothetical protein